MEPGLLLDDALEHHRVGAGVQEAPQPPAVLAPTAADGPPVEACVRHEMQARDGEEPVAGRVEVREIVAIADGAAALRLGIDAAEAEHEADEADRREDVEVIAEERKADEGRREQRE